MKEKRVAKLACGGKGPCCHIGYPHRHCEHCDVVISLHQCAPWYRQGGPYWLTSTTGALSSIGQFETAAGQQVQPAAPLPEPVNAFAGAEAGNGHVCEGT